MAQQHLTVVTLGVSDLDRARRFYRDGLGWEVVADIQDTVFVQVGHGLLLSLWGVAELAEDLGGAPLEQEGPGRFTLGCNVGSEAEVDAVVERFVAAGGSLVRPAEHAFWGGYQAYVADPEGFRWDVVHNPGMAFTEDGRAVLRDLS
ncbi:VOC family protein [Actinoalloteichus caeruleus]|uniref:VOC domain-containing protein n=1 Tax=Actinoalloteichus caeruleus DSM 43889 TaxID=1120930 RepID=A0ABT1JIT9_ACTCY|nr:VOC family protein [Actinoalloteichus caeruleus]MCP2332437.1 hypothetical protein [Actinoalloteichus caeruleus DSM 43889]